MFEWQLVDGLLDQLLAAHPSDLVHGLEHQIAALAVALEISLEGLSAMPGAVEDADLLLPRWKTRECGLPAFSSMDDSSMMKQGVPSKVLRLSYRVGREGIPEVRRATLRHVQALCAEWKQSFAATPTTP